MIAYGQCIGKKYPGIQPLVKVEEPETHRRCPRCKHTLPIKEFSFNKAGKRMKTCDQCREANNRSRRKR